MPYNVKQLGKKSMSIDFFIADPTIVVQFIEKSGVGNSIKSFRMAASICRLMSIPFAMSLMVMSSCDS